MPLPEPTPLETTNVCTLFVQWADQQIDPDVSTSGEWSAHHRLLELLRGYCVTQIGAALAELGVAEALGDEPQTVGSIAARLHLPEDGLRRLLRAATTAGLVGELTPGAYVGTELSRLLQPSAPGSLHNFARTVAGRGHWLPWGQLAAAVRSGEPQATRTLGISQWEHYRAHPDEGRRFAATMTDRTATQIAAIVASLDLSIRRRIVDVGGSEGALLAALLAAQPESSGVLFDLPDVVAANATNLSERIEVVGGDFFAGVPTGGDLYVLKNILHDWPDGDAARILASVRDAIADDGELAVIELVLPEAGQRSLAHYVDLSMMVTFGGRERTIAEFTALLGAAGFELVDVRALEDQADRFVLVGSPR
jgi:hypothetical protein